MRHCGSLIYSFLSSHVLTSPFTPHIPLLTVSPCSLPLAKCFGSQLFPKVLFSSHCLLKAITNTNYTQLGFIWKILPRAASSLGGCIVYFPSYYRKEFFQTFCHYSTWPGFSISNVRFLSLAAGLLFLAICYRWLL